MLKETSSNAYCIYSFVVLIWDFENYLLKFPRKDLVNDFPDGIQKTFSRCFMQQIMIKIGELHKDSFQNSAANCSKYLQFILLYTQKRWFCVDVYVT